MRIYSSTCFTLVALLAFGLPSLAAAEQPRDAAGGDVVASGHLALLHPAMRFEQALDALRHGRRSHQEKSKEPDDPDDPLRHLRRVQEDGGQPTTCEAALAEAEQTLAAYEEKEEEDPEYLFVQMADQCTF